MGTLNEAQVKIEEANVEKEWMKEGVWLREEDTMEMIESLMKVEDSFTDNGEAKKVKDVLNYNEYGSIAELFEIGETAMSLMVLEEEDVKSNNDGTDDVFGSLASLDEKWWESHQMVSGDDYDYSKYKWCFKSDTTMWEWTWYLYNTDEFPWDLIDMLNFVKEKGFSNY